MDFKYLPRLGAGIGLRRRHFQELPTLERPLDWLEVVPENYMAYGGIPLRALDACRERWRMVSHGVSMNLGGVKPLDEDYLERLKRLLDRIDSPWFSDHLCWTGVPGDVLHELLPLPFTREAVDHVVGRIETVRRVVDRPFLVENISYYTPLPGAEMRETDFLVEVLEKADCGLLLDVNNVYVNSRNHGFDPHHWIDQLPLERVVQIHMAGHDDSEPILVDTHGAPVCEDVWKLFEWVIGRTGPVTVVIERDMNIPPLEEVLDEADRVRAILARQAGADTGGGEVDHAAG